MIVWLFPGLEIRFARLCGIWCQVQCARCTSGRRGAKKMGGSFKMRPCILVEIGSLTLKIHASEPCLFLAQNHFTGILLEESKRLMLSCFTGIGTSVRAMRAVM